MNGVNDKRMSSPRHKGDGHSYQSLMSEELMLKEKVQIKSQALIMLSQELDQCRMQRDRFKLMAEQLQEDLVRRKQTTGKKVINGFKAALDFSIQRQGHNIIESDSVEEDTKLMDLLIESREQNKCLRLQVDTLRHKLKEAEEDIKALRSKRTEDPKLIAKELIEQLEKLNVKCVQLKLDLQAVLDEKQELEVEKDVFKCKAHRLNHELSMALSAPKPVDVDALIIENRYLQERLQQLLEEKELVQQSVQKYKSMLDSKRQKGALKLGGKSSLGSIMNFKQVEQLLQQGPNISPQKSTVALTELHSLCTALLEALNDKNLALAHQKKANKILAARMCELDRAVQSPTMKLLEGYSSADVDIRCDSTSVTSDLSEERSDGKESDVQCDESFVNEVTSDTQIGENSIKQSIQNKESDKCVIEENLEDKKYDESLIELDIKSNCKSFGYNDGSNWSRDKAFEKIDFEESLRKSLPEHLRLLVQKHFNELKAKEREGS
ncbi:PREDICTED: coiled-coil domain-containing protein 149 [Ceratosolen solmsi marchali]|uniref:Coiled-coil domain-containing protein 149 n=1 Tax=Ceratosolen solmsi marchali TaxID=326594 RepID=A0AAJ6YLC9_9HYME|nr:PREDICTED: coiled-coil domain-containing protein 149 [Ceratosolen solmsi marchali]